MATHLHARRKPPTHKDDDEESGHAKQSPLSGGYLKGKKASLRRALLSNELRWALIAVGSFLVAGIFLGYFLLHHQHRKVVLHIMKNPWAHGGAVLRGRAGFRHHFYSGPPRFVTIVMPSVVNPKGRNKRLKSIQDTWGQGARAIYVVHEVSEFPEAAHAVISDESQPEDPYSFPQLMLIPSDIGFDDGLPRLYHTIRTVFEKVNPDFAFFVNDHTFVIPEHLCKYLDRQDPNHDLYAGHALRNGKEDIFNSGAAGYLLSRSAMQKMIAKFDQKDPTCWVGSDAGKWLQGNPGLVTAKCLESLGIRAIDSRDAHKWHRFHAFPVTRVVSGAVDEWYKNKHADMGKFSGFASSYDELLSGEDCCSESTVSFHYVEHMESRALFSVREALLTNPHMTDQELKSLLNAEWPKDPKDIGGYSRGLPKKDDGRGWHDLIAVLRKISTRETQRDC